MTGAGHLKEKKMDKVFNLTSTFKSFEDDDGSVCITGMASTKDFDRAGDTIVPEAWSKGGLKSFEKNPIILFNHDYNKPIGRATQMKVTDDGLEMKAKISKSAPDSVSQLVKEGILGAFSVGFRIKDADYLEETDGLKIKDAELFEVSVVSVPCNQAATFSLAKSFDSEQDYEDFKKTFKSEEDSSSMETVMSEETQTPEVDLEAFAKKVAEETAAKIAMKQAEEKAAAEAVAKEAAEAEAAKAAEAEKVKTQIQSGIESGAEKLMSDIKEDMEKASVDQIAEVTAKYESQLKEKAEELEAMRNSKRDFSDRSKSIESYGKEFLNAKILGLVTRKGEDTQYMKDLREKTVGVTAITPSVKLDTLISNTFEEEVRMYTKIAGLFREIPVDSGATVMPIVPDATNAQWATTGLEATTNIVESVTNGGSAASDAFNVGQKVLRAYRLVSGSFITNDTDEQTVVNMLPMITSALARAHARALESTILNGNGTIAGFTSDNATENAQNGLAQSGIGSGLFLTAATDADISDADLLKTEQLIKMRGLMGKYGLDPADVVYIVNTSGYYELLQDDDFAQVNQVTPELAARVQGIVGEVYGSPVVASDLITRSGSGPVGTAALAVNVNNYVIPRLRGVNIETDYIVKEQRTALIASQSLGFEELVAGYAGNYPSVKLIYQA
mgnify:FL=1